MAALRDPTLPFTTVFQRDYNPVAYLTFVANLAVFGVRPWAWHAVDLAIHLACVALLFRLALRLSESTAAATLCALLFGTHAGISEPVVWSGARFHSESTLLALAAANAFLSPRPSIRRVAGPILFLLALGAKETAVGYAIVPLAFAIWEWARRGARADRVAAALPLLLVGPYTAARALLLPTPYVARALGTIDPGTAVTKAAITILSFLGVETRLPDHLLTVLVPPLSLLVLLLLTRDRVLAFGAIWTLALLAPFAALPFHSSRYCYLPWPGLCLLAARLAQLSAARAQSRLVPAVIAVAAVLFVGANVLMIQTEIGDYRDLSQVAAAELESFGPVAAAIENAAAGRRTPVVLVDASTSMPVRDAIARLHGRPKLVRPNPRAVAGVIPFPTLLDIHLARDRRYRFRATPDDGGDARAVPAGAALIVYHGHGEFEESPLAISVRKVADLDIARHRYASVGVIEPRAASFATR